MPSVKRFEDLECWQEARRLVSLIYNFTNRERFSKDFELKNQVRRSAVSIMANIAEGFHRNSNKDFMKFLDYSRASIAETLSHCYVALDQEYVAESDTAIIKQHADLVWKKVNNLISYLNKHSQPHPTHPRSSTNSTN
jgi:four helix bundle protein